MAVKIKLKRIGKIRVLIPHRHRRFAHRPQRPCDRRGRHLPAEAGSRGLIRVDSDRVQYWLSVGAQPTPPVMAILKVTGDWQKFKGRAGCRGTLKVAEPKADRKGHLRGCCRGCRRAKDRLEAVRPGGGEGRRGARFRRRRGCRTSGTRCRGRRRSRDSGRAPAETPAADTLLPRKGQPRRQHRRPPRPQPRRRSPDVLSEALDHLVRGIVDNPTMCPCVSANTVAG